MDQSQPRILENSFLIKYTVCIESIHLEITQFNSNIHFLTCASSAMPLLKMHWRYSGKFSHHARHFTIYRHPFATPTLLFLIAALNTTNTLPRDTPMENNHLARGLTRLLAAQSMNCWIVNSEGSKLSLDLRLISLRNNLRSSWNQWTWIFKPNINGFYSPYMKLQQMQRQMHRSYESLCNSENT